MIIPLVFVFSSEICCRQHGANCNCNTWCYKHSFHDECGIKILYSYTPVFLSISGIVRTVPFKLCMRIRMKQCSNVSILRHWCCHHLVKCDSLWIGTKSMWNKIVSLSFCSEYIWINGKRISELGFSVR